MILEQMDEYIEKRIERIPFGGCWIWTGYVHTNGYGRFYNGGGSRLAHRVVYERLKGQITEETLDHLCRVRCCVNPAHLEPVPLAVNILRGQAPAAINARKMSCNKGHPFVLGSHWVGPKGKRYCRECRQLRQRAKA